MKIEEKCTCGDMSDVRSMLNAERDRFNRHRVSTSLAHLLFVILEIVPPFELFKKVHKKLCTSCTKMYHKDAFYIMRRLSSYYYKSPCRKINNYELYNERKE